MRPGIVRAALVAGMIVLGCNPPPGPSRPSAGQLSAAKSEHEHEHEGAHAHSCSHERKGGQPLMAAGGLVRIEPGHVCMLSNRFLGEKQHVPVAVEGKTYFGCCANCAARIGERAEARLAVDPVSGRSVDKASAVLARDESNKVLYFESEETLATLQARSR